MTFIPAPPREHTCDTPRSGHLGTHYDPGTLWQCDVCEQWWYAEDGERITGNVVWSSSYTVWRPVGWWDFKLRRRIREHQHEKH
jgi:hypothetical protein